MASTNLIHTQSAGNRRKGTFSAWVKRANIGYQYLISWNSTTSGTSLGDWIRFNDDRLDVIKYTGSVVYRIQTNRKFRDTSAWYHIVVAYDSEQSTASDRVKIYVNGIQETSFQTSSYPSEDYDFEFNNNNIISCIGRNYNTEASFDGYMSHVSWVDGQQLAPTVFGQTDSTSGIWKFKSPSGVTWGTNGFHLKMENSGALGTDSSGNSNTFTINGNLTQALDTPSNVYATFNPLLKTPSGLSYLNGNTTVKTTNSQWEGSISTIAPTKGKWYWEARYNTGTGIKLDIVREPADLRFFDNSNQSYGSYNSNGYGYQLNNSGTDYYCSNNTCTTWSSSRGNSTKIYMVAVDLDNGKYWIGADGTWFNTSGTANPATGADPRHSFSAKLNGDAWFMCMSCEGNGNGHNANFGNGFFGTTAISSAGSNGNGSLFEYDVPSGFYALNTKNINTYG